MIGLEFECEPLGVILGSVTFGGTIGSQRKKAAKVSLTYLRRLLFIVSLWRLIGLHGPEVGKLDPIGMTQS
jgi:hypothetical protein